MHVPIAANKTIKGDDMSMSEVVVEVDGRIQSLVVEAKTGKRGYVTFIEKDRHGQLVRQNGKLVHKTIHGEVTAWRMVPKE